jgi:hypothetical protein
MPFSSHASIRQSLELFTENPRAREDTSVSPFQRPADHNPRKDVLLCRDASHHNDHVASSDKLESASSIDRVGEVVHHTQDREASAGSDEQEHSLPRSDKRKVARTSEHTTTVYRLDGIDSDIDHV